jgi:hypothetical protein
MKDLKSKENFVVKLRDILPEIMGVKPADIKFKQSPKGSDAIIEVDNRKFIVEYKPTASKANIFIASANMLDYIEDRHFEYIPIVAFPFMGESLRKYCSEHGINWIDLSGNARIISKDLRIILDGNPNKYISPGRPKSLFAPMSSRITRWLLMNQDKSFTQRQLTNETRMSEGFVSRIVKGLKEEGFVENTEDGKVKTSEPNLLFNSWKEKYNFSKHLIIKGHVPTRSSNELVNIMKDKLDSYNFKYALTGLAAAWSYSHFAGFRTVSIYIKEELPDEILNLLNFRREEKGANLWLVVPIDEGVFHGESKVDGLNCVHPIQTYLDLKYHPERSKEAAERLREEYLKWIKK